MKKITAIILALALLLCFASCGEKKEEPPVTAAAPVAEKTFEDELLERSRQERPKAQQTDGGYLAPASEKQLFGYINSLGEWVIEPKFSAAYCYNEEYAPVLDEYSEYVQIDRNGEAAFGHINKMSVSTANHLSFGTILVGFDNKEEQNKAFVDINGEIIIDASELPQTSGVKYANKKYFAVASRFVNDYAVGMRRTNASVVKAYDKDYQKLADKKYYQSPCVLDRSGNVHAVLPAGLDIYPYSLDVNGLIIVQDMTKENGLFGLYNVDGQQIAECKYYMIEYCDNGLYLACDESGFWGYIDQSGNKAIDFKYQVAYPFSEGLAAVKEKDKFGFIDTNGKYVIEPSWDDVGKLKYADIDTNIGMAAFSCGVAAVKHGEFWLLIDSEENIIDVLDAYTKECPYYSAANDMIAFKEYTNGFASGYSGVINTKGELVLEPNFRTIGLFN